MQKFNGEIERRKRGKKGLRKRRDNGKENGNKRKEKRNERMEGKREIVGDGG